MTKAPLGGEATGHNPTDRSKSGTKRSMHTEGNGIPLGVAVDGANRHDKKMMVKTLDADVIERPQPTEDNPQHMALDKAYDSQDIRDILIAKGYIPHVRARGEESKQKREIPHYRARRWVVERTHSWLNRFRRLLIRWEKKVKNYSALIDFACAWIVFHAAGLFG
ncbi:MAG: IS5 family transposase, partial [bacterium]